MKSAVASPVDRVLKDELARADRALSGVAPVLGHALAQSGHSLVTDEAVARVRGMLNDLAAQMVARLGVHAEGESAPFPHGVETLAEQLAGDAPILACLHALAMEGLLTQKLEQRASIDPALSPLWQELIASPDAAIAELAMQALTAQSRFLQSQRRMQQPLLELSPEALERALRIWVRATPLEHEAAVTQKIRELKVDYDEAQTRAGLLARLVSTMRGGVIAAFDIEHAGVALFASALAQQSGQSRERAILACHDQQAARLAVGLRASGAEVSLIRRQFVTLNIAPQLQAGLEALSTEMAKTLLQDSEIRADWEGAR